MKLKNTALTGGDGLAHPKISPDELTEIRLHVISGDWTAINNRVCTLTDLGLRHNGGGLVWLSSGVSVHQADHDTGVSGKDKTVGSVNGLPIQLVRQWAEFWTKQSFAVSVPTELRRQHYPDDAEFGKAMREAGYVPVRTKQITGKEARFWLYRKTGNDKGLSLIGDNKNNELFHFVQASEKPKKAFKRVAVDGKWLFVYEDHIRFLTKKRVRVDGKQVTGYTAKGVRLEVLS